MDRFPPPAADRKIASRFSTASGTPPPEDGPKETIDVTTNPNERATDSVNRTAQEMLAALLAEVLSIGV
jgi:hypothetical protein